MNLKWQIKKCFAIVANNLDKKRIEEHRLKLLACNTIGLGKDSIFDPMAYRDELGIHSREKLILQRSIAQVQSKIKARTEKYKLKSKRSRTCS